MNLIELQNYEYDVSLDWYFADCILKMLLYYKKGRSAHLGIFVKEVIMICVYEKLAQIKSMMRDVSSDMPYTVAFRRCRYDQDGDTVVKTEVLRVFPIVLIATEDKKLAIALH